MRITHLPIHHSHIPFTPTIRTAYAHLPFTIHTSHSHLLLTPMHTSHSQFTPPIHASNSPLFTPPIHTGWKRARLGVPRKSRIFAPFIHHSHIPFTPPIHTADAHLPFTMHPIHTSDSHRFTPPTPPGNALGCEGLTPGSAEEESDRAGTVVWMVQREWHL